VDAGLLARADADGLSAEGVADGVGLRVFQRDERDDEVARSGFRQVLVCGDDVGKQFAVDDGSSFLPCSKVTPKTSFVSSGAGT
jgi:hypothetical protein